MLNGTHDRETNGFSASSFVTAITDALNRTYGDPCNRLENPVSQNSFTIETSWCQIEDSKLILDQNKAFDLHVVH